MKFRVTEDWQATYADPIRLQAGDVLYLTGLRDDWDGHIWVWARSASCLKGWIPDTIVSKANAGCVATEDYTAAELTCRTGQVVTAEMETHGWVFCRLPDGCAGLDPKEKPDPECRIRSSHRNGSKQRIRFSRAGMRLFGEAEAQAKKAELSAPKHGMAGVR